MAQTGLPCDFADFCAALLESGFSLGGGNAKGIYAVVPYGWEEQQFLDTPVKWHTGDPETDPWEWRMRVLEERRDIAYSKVFFGVSGYITASWYPLFLAVRRGGTTLEAAYRDGNISQMAKRIYELLAENGALPFHEIKSRCAIRREESGRFERAMVELQMRLFITMCGRAQRTNQLGQGYGWSSTVFCTVEDFWVQRDVPLPDVDPQEAYERIRERVLALHPTAEEKRIRRFIEG